jgi:hypothetical protein
VATEDVEAERSGEVGRAQVQALSAVGDLTSEYTLLVDQTSCFAR